MAESSSDSHECEVTVSTACWILPAPGMELSYLSALSASPPLVNSLHIRYCVSFCLLAAVCLFITHIKDFVFVSIVNLLLTEQRKAKPETFQHQDRDMPVGALLSWKVSGQTGSSEEHAGC